MSTPSPRASDEDLQPGHRVRGWQEALGRIVSLCGRLRYLEDRRFQNYPDLGVKTDSVCDDARITTQDHYLRPLE
jgi:hypothetical protein